MRLPNTFIMVFCTVGVLVLWGVFIAYYGRLPETIAIHFGPTGVPNGFGAKPMLLIFPLLGLAAYALGMLFHYAALPGRNIMTPLVHSLIFLECGELVWFWFFLQLETIRIALGYSAGLDNGFYLPFGVLMATAVAVAVGILASSRRRTPQR